MIWGYPLWLRKPPENISTPLPSSPGSPHRRQEVAGGEAPNDGGNLLEGRQIDHTTHSQPTMLITEVWNIKKPMDNIQSMVIPLWWKSHHAIGHPLWMEGWMQIYIYIYIYKLGSCQLAMFDYRRVTPRKKNEQQCNRKYVEDIPYITL